MSELAEAHRKRNNQQNKEATYQMRENICKHISGKALISKIYKQINKSIAKNKYSDFKSGQGT